MSAITTNFLWQRQLEFFRVRRLVMLVLGMCGHLSREMLSGASPWKKATTLEELPAPG